MLALDHPNVGSRDYSLSAEYSRAAIVEPACGPSPERSDPYMEWATSFDQELKLAFARIRDWSRDPESLADDDLEAPSREAMVRTVEILNQLKVLVMDRVAPTPAILLNLKGVFLGSDGKISIELGSGPFAMTYRIEADGAVTRLLFRDNHLVQRDRMPG